jgi:hypothetical protein
MDNQITKSRLLVPADQELRMKIRMKSREVVFRHKIQPPARLELIEALAREVLAGLNIEADYLAFAMVNCGNEIWRSVVEAVPFERRLLLLPQCLRNSNSCKGSFDEFGCFVPVVVSAMSMLCSKWRVQWATQHWLPKEQQWPFR